MSYELIVTDGIVSGLRVTFDQTWLNDPSRKWPVKIDPPVAVGSNSGRDTFVQSNILNTSQGGSTELNVGKCPDSTSCGGSNIVTRSLLWFPLPAEVQNKTVLSVDLNTYNFHSYSCSQPSALNVHSILADWSEDVTWPNQPSTGAQLASTTAANGNGCPAAWIRHNATGLTAEVNGWAHGAANNGLALLADESNINSWKKFNSREGGGTTTMPYLWIQYNRAPNPPVQQSPDDNKTLMTFDPPTLVIADGGDPDGDTTRQYNYEISSGGTSLYWSGWSTNASLIVPNGLLKDGGRYAWRAQAKDAFDEGTWSPWRYFKLDALRLGPRGYFPMDAHAIGDGVSASANLASGNLVVEGSDVNLPTVTAPFSFVRTYNSKASGKGLQVYLDEDNQRPSQATFTGAEDGWNWSTA
ncbi:MAG: DNRLRE domain-containing protein, partial [Actinomycetota bacterium]